MSALSLISALIVARIALFSVPHRLYLMFLRHSGNFSIFNVASVHHLFAGITLSYEIAIISMCTTTSQTEERLWRVADEQNA